MVARIDSNSDNGDATNGEYVEAELIEFPLRDQRRLVRRKGAPSAEVIAFGPHLEERKRQIRVVRRAAQIRSILAEADYLTGADSDEAAW